MMWQAVATSLLISNTPSSWEVMSTHFQLVKQNVELMRRENLGKIIRQLLFCREVSELNKPFKHFFPSVVVIYLYMLSPLMEDWITCNM